MHPPYGGLFHARERAITMSKRTIIYRRVSGEEQKKNNSPSAQETDGRAYAEKHGLTVIDSLLEDFTGTTIDRPVFNRLLELADAGLFDALIVQHPDRLGRGPILELAIALLDKRGIEVHAYNRDGIISNEDDENAQIQNAVDGMVSGIERRNIRRRTTRGMIEKVTLKQQLPGHGTAPYGYSFIGRREDRTLVICEEEAAVVKQIFEWYVSGVTVISICDRLTLERVPTPAVGHDNRGIPEDRYRWGTYSVYRILKHTIYAGTFQAFKLHKAGHKKMHATVAVPAPAIVSPELFERAQTRMATGRKLSRRNVKQFYLLRSRVRCGTCGKALCGVTDRIYRYYRCTARRRDAKQPCTARSFIAADVEYTAWQWLDSHVLHEENLRTGIEQKNALMTSERTRLEERLAYYSQRIDAINQESKRLMQLYQAALYTLNEIEPEKRQLDASRTQLEHERTQVEQQLANLGVSDEDKRELLATVHTLKEEVQYATDETKRKIIDWCDVFVTLYMRDGAPWMHIEAKLTVQSDNLPIVSQLRYGFKL